MMGMSTHYSQLITIYALAYSEVPPELQVRRLSSVVPTEHESRSFYHDDLCGHIKTIKTYVASVPNGHVTISSIGKI
jgi:hypothetical protein